MTKNTNDTSNTGDAGAAKKSPLSRTFIDGDKHLQIVISADGNGAWLLELIDQHANATHWEDAFKTEQDALDEALAAIKEEGIDMFIGPAGGYGDLS